jgi:hypothetical protein
MPESLVDAVDPVDVLDANAGIDAREQLAQHLYLKASNAGSYDEFGYTIAISGDTLVIGGRFDDSNAIGVDGDQTNALSPASGAVFVFVRSGTTWVQQAYLKASNTDTDDAFGGAVAISGDTLVVGARFEDSASVGVDGDQADDTATDAGAAYVFTRTAGVWSQQAYLKASNTEAGDELGVAVAVSGDTIAVAAHREGSDATTINGNQGNGPGTQYGAAYVFTRTAGVWSQQAYIKGSQVTAGSLFGGRLALAGDTLVVPARLEASSSGSVYVFTRSGTTWSEQVRLRASNAGAGDRFGQSVGLSGDTLAVGALGEDSSAAGVDGAQGDNSALESGAAYVFTRSGAVWTQQAYLKASNTDPDDSFGHSIAVFGDTIVVGANAEKSLATGVDGDQANNGSSFAVPLATPTGPGAAYVFQRVGTSWSQRAYLKASNTVDDMGSAGGVFGYAVALDDQTIAVGAIYEDGQSQGIGGDQTQPVDPMGSAENSGAVYLFR